MHLIRYNQEAEDGLVKCVYLDIGKFRFLAALSESIWYTKEKKRQIPIWINKNGLFIFKLAIKLGVSMIQLGKLSLNLWTSYDDFNLMRCLGTMDDKNVNIVRCAIDLRIGLFR